MTVLRYMTDYMTDPHRHDGRHDSLECDCIAADHFQGRVSGGSQISLEERTDRVIVPLLSRH